MWQKKFTMISSRFETIGWGNKRGYKNFFSVALSVRRLMSILLIPDICRNGLLLGYGNQGQKSLTLHCTFCILVLQLDISVFILCEFVSYLILYLLELNFEVSSVKHCTWHKWTWNFLLFDIWPQPSVMRTWHPLTNFPVQLCSFSNLLLLFNVLILNML